ncbi:hypothetical protein CF335_g8157, partial [Tilletia laevis]
MDVDAPSTAPSADTQPPVVPVVASPPLGSLISAPSTAEKGGTVASRAKQLGVGVPTLYSWKQTHDQGINLGCTPAPDSALAEELTSNRSRSSASNLAIFLKPQDANSLAREPGGSRNVSGVRSNTQVEQERQSSTAFERADGLGPQVESEETFGAAGPGVLPPELVEQLRISGALATDAEIAGAMAIQLDADTRPGAQTFVNETIDLALHLKQSTLAPGTKANWDRCKSSFLTFWRCLNRIRSQQPALGASFAAEVPSPLSMQAPARVISSPSASAAPAANENAPATANAHACDAMEVHTEESSAESEAREQSNVDEVLVSEQKLVTYLNCFVLHRNPQIGDEGLETHVKAIVNLWETQVLKGANTFPHPRNGALLKAFRKAVRRHKVQHSELLGEDTWKHSLNDGYTEDQHLEISQWYLRQMSQQPSTSQQHSTIAYPASASDACDTSTWRARFDFLMQHAIMGRSEDLRKAKLSRLYTRTLPQSQPQACPAFVVTIPRSKVNTEGRKEVGIAARHKNVEACPVGALALFFYERWHTRKEPFPNFSSRASWYHLMLLTDCEDDAVEGSGVTWDDQAQVLKKAFSDLGIATSNVTHAMRGGGARMAFERGCSEDSIRKHGRWTAGGDQLIERYLTGVALQPVRALAGFSAGGGDYWLPRTLVEPPLALQQQLWPEIEEAETTIKERHRTGGETDQAALNFLALLKWLRTVMLQDAACLRHQYEGLPIWSMPPFDTTAFGTFASALTAAMSAAVSPIEVTITQLVPA